MPLPEDLLNPVLGSADPSGANLRFDPLYDRLKEARREDSQPPVGMTEQDRKVADNVLVIKLSTEALKTRTKDLQIAAWLTEALLKQNGFSGLRQGLAVFLGLLDTFWETVHPRLDEGDPQNRLAPIGFIETKLDIPLKLAPVVETARFSFLDYKESREVGFEADAKSDDAKKKRAFLIKEKKLEPEVFDKAFVSTSKQFYAQSEKDLDYCLQVMKDLKTFCDPRFEDGPSFSSFIGSLVEVRHLIHTFLQKKRETEPDPIEAPTVLSHDGEVSGGGAISAPAPAGILISVENSSEPLDRMEYIRMVAEAAAYLRKREPKSPASYLMTRGLRWGELRAAVDNSNPRLLEAPPTDLRKHLKRLALDARWQELLTAAESAMALPCSRAWLDLQRYVVEACTALGSDYDLIAQSIRSELKNLIADFPQLPDAALTDDTPAANFETRAWLKSIASTNSDSVSVQDDAEPSKAAVQDLNSKWPRQPRDAQANARQAVRDGELKKAFEFLQLDINQQRSGRERFRRKMHLVDICISTSRQNIAQPILDDLSAMIETHKLDEWEDPRMVADALATIMKFSARVQADKGQQQKIFERICRLNAAEALGEVQ